MKHMTCCYRRLNIIKIKIGVLAIFVSIFFLPSYVPFEKLGNNMFTVILNNKEAGVVASPEEAEEYALEARRRIASDSEELVLVEGDLETVGSEVLWGKIDAPGQVIDNMVEIFRSDVKETLQRSYVVKINEYMVNLSRKDEVISLLQAALDKYDSESRYQVELHLDPARELSVLTTQIQNQEEAVEEEIGRASCRERV